MPDNKDPKPARAGSVFKVSKPPAVNVNATRQVMQEPAGKNIVRSQRSGDPLPEGSADTQHEPVIPWPPASNDRKPFKLND